MKSSARSSVTIDRLIAVLTTSPHYLFGRFHVVRVAYSQIQRARQTFAAPRSTLQLSDKYADTYRTISVERSRLVESQADAQTHACNVSLELVLCGNFAYRGRCQVPRARSLILAT